VNTELAASQGGIDQQESVEPWEERWGEYVDGCNCHDLDGVVMLSLFRVQSRSLQYAKASGSVLHQAGYVSHANS
jgi:hypothetical protein